MRRIRYGMYVSLDGYIAGPNGELDWHDIGEELHQYVNAEWETIDTHLYGRRMYEAMRYWETADADPSLTAYARRTAHLWQRAEHLVFSKTLTPSGGTRAWCVTSTTRRLLPSRPSPVATWRSRAPS